MEKHHYIVKQGTTYTLWDAYAPGSGMVAVFNKKMSSFITNKNDHDNYNHLADRLGRNCEHNKVIAVPIYDYNEDPRRYSVWAGDKKPAKMMYMVVSEDAYVVINFFDSKLEAKYWVM